VDTTITEPLREASVASRFQWVSDSADAQIDALYELYGLYGLTE